MRTWLCHTKDKLLSLNYILCYTLNLFTQINLNNTEDKQVL